MRLTQLFPKTSKNVSADAESINAQLLTKAGFVDQEMAGVYSWLPLGLKVLRKVENIVREEMNALGAQELLMPALQSKEHWDATGRWDAVDVLFKLPSQTGKQYGLGPTHEEIITPLVQKFVQSYKDLPLALYQIQTKFRDELRAKSGVLRGREFGMKDLYSFHANHEDLEAFYAKALKAYLKVFTRCGLNAKVVEASGGSFTKKFSHEFQVITPAGEDVILACAKCEYGQNSEVTTFKEGDACPKCGSKLSKQKGVEVGNIFDLGTKFSEAFGLSFTDEKGEKKPVIMGCYGIGTTRLVGTIVEASHDVGGIIWPKSVAPAMVYIAALGAKTPEATNRVWSAATELYEDLKAAGVEVLFDDRLEARAGEKFADADLIGIPLRLIISEKTLDANSVEWKARTEEKSKLVGLAEAIDAVQEFIKA